MSGLRRVAGAIALALTLPACAVQGLNFVQDERLTITSPTDREEVELPVTISWRVEGFRVTGPDGARRADAGYFGVFVDRHPQAPGETLESLVVDDEGCRIAPDCPSPEYLARQHIHSTSDTSFTLERILDPTPEDQRRGRRLHEVTIVFLNGRGERIGESSFTVRFEVP